MVRRRGSVALSAANRAQGTRKRERGAPAAPAQTSRKVTTGIVSSRLSLK